MFIIIIIIIIIINKLDIKLLWSSYKYALNIKSHTEREIKMCKEIKPVHSP
jgi:hypothetical protein